MPMEAAGLAEGPVVTDAAAHMASTEQLPALLEFLCDNGKARQGKHAMRREEKVRYAGREESNLWAVKPPRI